MEEKTLKASDNAEMANALIEQALADPKKEDKPIEIKLPQDTTVNLPGGYVKLTGEVIRTAEVRELNGFDEEAIARAGTVGKIMNTILNRAVVKIGDEKATEELLDGLLSGDRDALALGIFRATFGNEAEVSGFCSGCEEFKTVLIDTDTDIKVKMLMDPVGDRRFTVSGRSHEYEVGLPTGRCQRELNVLSGEKTLPEMQTVLLEHTVLSIDGKPVYSPNAIKGLGVVDRRTIAEAIGDRNPGPQLEAVTAECPDCGTAVVVPINFGTLFRL